MENRVTLDDEKVLQEKLEEAMDDELCFADDEGKQEATFEKIGKWRVKPEADQTEMAKQLAEKKKDGILNINYVKKK